MGERQIYFLFTDTGTWLSKLIYYCTKQRLNHVSIGFDADLKEVYSFGRKCPKNPFAGGFVKEDIRSDFLKNAGCAVYEHSVTVTEWDSILANIKEIEARKHSYKYNFVGLLGVLFHVRFRRKRALFCSEFVATVVKDVPAMTLEKPAWFVTPADIMHMPGMRPIYAGRLGSYGRQVLPVQIKGKRQRWKIGFPRKWRQTRLAVK